MYAQTQLARVSLAKFSHTTTPNNQNGPLNWNHMFGNGDMSAVLERQTTTVLFKVFRGVEILEEVDLTYHTQEAARQTGGNQIKPAFAVIVKSPCLAVKYPTDGNCRRFQVKFSSDRDYYAILAILSSIDCPFSESNGTSQSGRRATWRTQSVSYQAPNVAGSSSSSSQPGSTTAYMDLTSQSNAPVQPTQLGQLRQPVQPNTPDKTACHDPQTLNQILPPKRDLPFSKPAAKKARMDTGPTLTPPTPIQGGPQGLETGITAGTGTGPRRSQTAFAPTRTGISPTSMTSGPSLSITSGPTPGPAPEPALDPGLGLPSQRLRPDPSIPELTAYTASPTPARIARLETWLCEHIQDDAFLQLCQDVEGVWKRVAFGSEKS